MENKKEHLIGEPLNEGKSRCFSLLMYFSHLCLSFPAELTSLSEEQRTASFFIILKENEYSLEEWLDTFRFNFPYKIQSVVFGEEKEPLSLSVKLLDKQLVDGKVSLEFRFLGSLLSPSLLKA